MPPIGTFVLQLTAARPLQMRSDKVIVFSDNIFALRSYAVALNKPFIYGATSHAERTRVLHAFKHSATVSISCA